MTHNLGLTPWKDRAFSQGHSGKTAIGGTKNLCSIVSCSIHKSFAGMSGSPSPVLPRKACFMTRDAAWYFSENFWKWYVLPFCVEEMGQVSLWISPWKGRRAESIIVHPVQTTPGTPRLSHPEGSWSWKARRKSNLPSCQNMSEQLTLARLESII